MLVSYDDPNHLWPYFYEELKNILPVRRAEPLNSSVSSFHNIVAVPFPLTTLKFHQFSQDTFGQRNMLSLHEQYHVHLSLVACDELETYKKKVLGQVSAWLENIHTRRNQHCLIVHATSTISETTIINSRSRSISRADLVFEQLTTDFGGSRNNRIVQLYLRDRKNDSWNVMIKSLSDAIYTSFWSHIATLDEDIRRLEAQKDLPGWNFCSFFTTKEGLALGYEDAALYKEALKVYTQLYDLFLYIVTNKKTDAPEWMKNNGSLEQLLARSCMTDSSTTKEIREKIAKCAANLFELLSYIFCNRMRLIKLTNDPTSLLETALELLTHINPDELGAQQWKFDFALFVISIADSIFAKIKDPSPKEIGNFKYFRGTLALVARQQLSASIQVLHPNFLPGISLGTQEISRLDHGLEIIKPSDINIFDLNIWEIVVKDRNRLFSTYMTLTRLAIEGMVTRKAYRFLDFLKVEEAILLILQGDAKNAGLYIDELISGGKYLNWFLLQERLYDLRSICALHLKDYQRALTDILMSWDNSVTQSPWRDLKKYVERLITVSKLSQEPLKADLEQLFNYSVHNVLTNDQLNGNHDKIRLDINWPHSIGIELDSVILAMASDRADITFQANFVELKPCCLNKIDLHCATPAAGSYTPMELTIRIGAIKLMKSFLSDTSKQTIELQNELSDCEIAISLPEICVIDQPRLQLTIKAIGRDLAEGELMLASPDVQLNLGSECLWRLTHDDIVKDLTVSAMNDKRIRVPALSANGFLRTTFEISKWRPDPIVIRADYFLDKYCSSRWLTVLPDLQWEYKFIPTGTLSTITIWRTDKLSPTKLLKSWTVSEGQTIKKSLMKHELIMSTSQKFNRVLRMGQSLAIELDTDHPRVIVFPQSAVNLSEPRLELKCETWTDCSSCKLGIPIELNLRIASERPIRFKYELDYSSDCWMISGVTKGMLSTKDDNETIIQQFSLIAIRSGTLSLPSLQLIIMEKSSSTIIIHSSRPHVLFVEPSRAKEKTFVLTSA